MPGHLSGSIDAWSSLRDIAQMGIGGWTPLRLYRCLDTAQEIWVPGYHLKRKIGTYLIIIYIHSNSGREKLINEMMYCFDLTMELISGSKFKIAIVTYIGGKGSEHKIHC